MRVTRRWLLQAGATAAALAVAPKMARGERGRLPAHVSMEELDLHALAARAVDAARSAGATYADVRLTLTRLQLFYNLNPLVDGEDHGVGIRVLVNGYWGFLSSSVWTADEMARLATEAVAQARAHSRGRTRQIDLGTLPIVVDGTWAMPVKYDPFDVPVGEKLDVISAAHDFAVSYRAGIDVASRMNFMREMKVFASSEGSRWTQTTYNTSAAFSVGYRSEYHAGLAPGGAAANFMSPAGRGWEHVLESGLIQAIPQLVDEAEQSRHVVPVDVGRYDMVLAAPAMAAVLDGTIGSATELDRAMGDEANEGGTSYLSNPFEKVGVLQVGSALLSVTGDRSTPGGAATVAWDDESVVPEHFPLVRDGLLVDYQTTREQAAWLAPYYRKIGKPIRSHGCASAESAQFVTMQHTPNLAMTPDAKDVRFNDLVAGIKKGVAVMSLVCNMDQQRLNGAGYGTMREITNGKLGRFILGGSIVFRAPELWKNLAAIGGAQSQQWVGLQRGKGQPWQRTTHSVGAVPGTIIQLAMVDATRRAS